ncbi:MAG: DUF2326 domain-containing protein [Gemmatimonadaceae bacterium]|nr:DUF2326 domain-containing protein [Gemmatimonadaceae bacterium]
MIHSVDANKPTFHRVEFGPGLNVILADRTDTSTDRDTRNGVGKSTLFEIIDFCLGSGFRKNSHLAVDELRDWEFSLELTILGTRVVVTRATATAGVVVVDGPTTGWPIQPEERSGVRGRFLKVERWKELLGSALFGLPTESQNGPYAPSFRSLISYFLRLGSAAYATPFEHFAKQKKWDVQVHCAYLIGLSWEVASSWQLLRDREARVKALEAAIKTGAIGGESGTAGELESRRVRLEREVEVAAGALSTFRVHPQYDAIQSDADRLTSEIHSDLNANVVDRRLLARYIASLADEKPSDERDVRRLFEESGVELPGSVVRSLDEVRAFHASVVRNRRAFLEGEVSRVERLIAVRAARVAQSTSRRAEMLQVLQSHGALQEMTKLQERFVLLRGELDRIVSRIADVRGLTESKREVKAQRVDLSRVAATEHAERTADWSEMILRFSEHSESLYSSPGQLTIDIDERGYRLNVDIDRSGSEGIDKMKVFCFDLAMLQRQCRLGTGIKFLVHDSLLYDSVDVRQRARALERAQQVTFALGAQYICALNSDMVPYEEFTDEFKFDSFVRLRLSDADPSERLLGIAFKRQGE